MVITVLAVLAIWLIASAVSFYSIAKLFVDNVIVRKPSQMSAPKIDISAILQQNSGLISLVRDIIRCEERPESELTKTRLAILKSKLKITVRNPVARQALIDAIKHQKK